MAKFRALVSKFPYNIIQYTYRIILFLLLKEVCSRFYYAYSSFTQKLLDRTIFPSSNIILNVVL